MNEREMSLAVRVADKIKNNGGEVTFDEYDKLMFKEKYFTPMNWVTGWGLPASEKKANNDKLCVFAACKAGLVVQTRTGYILKEQGENKQEIYG